MLKSLHSRYLQVMEFKQASGLSSLMTSESSTTVFRTEKRDLHSALILEEGGMSVALETPAVVLVSPL